ncbi:plasmid mobilization relaxosome protein MobC [Bradyrhizobium sp. CCGUVB14]|uniref:plasmid mobilization relaxosome protein MobC n=1 Tax=Bradyrhizobium sp. CCGUVB14 TaxID=2949628 RepID=UPI0020B2F9DE|nr:plasmid mobilization relaxosome protein MobC [Bradyrhizobium sp. CCGUVB14]MCP3439802.1 MobC family plasmid mobilization relaxosome protein [Bradyrhizobium sp. CCGUVB14]
MARPKLDITRNRQFNVGLTDAEFAKLLQAARVAGMRPVDYVRAKIFAKALPARTALAVRQLDPLLLTHLARIGNNLNQVARQIHQLDLESPADLAPALAELRAILREALKG